MANDMRYYYSLPTQAPQSRSASRRPPLTPSTVSSPCLSTHAPVVTRRDSGTGSPTKASTLLAKVASHPSTPRGETPMASPIPSPDSRPADLHAHTPYGAPRPAVSRTESARYLHQQQQRHQDGYISFPDFEKFCQSQNPYQTQHREHTAVKT